MVPDQPESTRSELTRWWVRVEWDYLLEQLCLTLVVIYIPGSIVVVLPREQPIQPSHYGIQLGFYRGEFLCGSQETLWQAR